MEASEEISRAVRRARNALRRLEPKTQRAATRLTFASRKIRREPDAHALRSTIPNLPEMNRANRDGSVAAVQSGGQQCFEPLIIQVLQNSINDSSQGAL